MYRTFMSPLMYYLKNSLLLFALKVPSFLNKASCTSLVAGTCVRSPRTAMEWLLSSILLPTFAISLPVTASVYNMCVEKPVEGLFIDG